MNRILGFLKLVIFAPFVLAAIAFCVANRGLVRVSLDPVTPEQPLLSFSAPLFALLLAATAIGVVLGGTGAWFAASRDRKAFRALKRENARLREERAPRLDGRGVAQPRPGAATSRELAVASPAALARVG